MNRVIDGYCKVHPSAICVNKEDVGVNIVRNFLIVDINHDPESDKADSLNRPRQLA